MEPIAMAKNFDSAILQSAQEWFEKTQNEFMQAQIEQFARGEIEIENENGKLIPCKSGFYSRLSAPGYLDCTDWNGPFKTENQALIELFNLYGDD